MDNKLQLIQEEVARINQISEYDNSEGSTKTLSNDLSKIVIHHTKQQSKSMLTESVSNTNGADFNLNNIFATMDGNYLIVEGQVVDLKTEASKGHIFDNDFLTYLEVAESQRDTLYREGLYEASWEVNDTILRISDRLRKHGEIIFEDGQQLMEQWYRVDKHAKSLYDYGKKKLKQGTKYIKKKAGEVWDSGKKWLKDSWKTVKKYAGDGIDWIKDKANKAWKWTKKNFLAILAKGFIWIAQALEAALFSVAGIVVDVVLGFTGIGAIPMAILWGIVAVYRIHIWFKEGGWMNFLLVICCLMGMLPGGALIAKGFRAGSSVLKGATTATSAAAKIGKHFKPTQVNWLSKVAIGLKDLLGSVFKAITWLLKHVPGFSGIAASLRNIGAKIGKNLDKMIAPITKIGSKIPASSTTIGVVTGSVLGIEMYKAFSDGMNLEDIKESELALYDDYEAVTGPEGNYRGVGEPFSKVSQNKQDFTLRTTEETPMTASWDAKTHSPEYKNMMLHPFFDGYEIVQDKPYDADPTIWKVSKCSKLYGCPPGLTMKDGVAVKVSDNILADDEPVEFTQDMKDEYETYADAEVERRLNLAN